jgi:hypothetical protein
MMVLNFIVINLKYLNSIFQRAAGKLFLLLLFAIFCFPALLAQTFNTRIDLLNQHWQENGFSVEKMNNGNYLLFIGSFAETWNDLISARIEIDQEGTVINTIWEYNESGKLYVGYPNTSTKIQGGYVSSGSLNYFSTELQSVATLNVYNDFGELLWYKLYGDSIVHHVGAVATQQSNGNFALVGFWGTINPGQFDDVRGLLIITDEEGNQLAEKLFGGSGVDFLGSIYPTNDGGYILGGTSTPYGAAGNDNLWVVKTDGMGNHQWSKIIGTPRTEYGTSVIQTMDGNFVVAGSLNHHNETASPLSEPHTQLFLTKLGNNGQMLWEHVYQDEYPHAQIKVVKELPNGDLISAGYTKLSQIGFLLRTDSDGNELWYREYHSPTQQWPDPGLNYVHDVIYEPDDGGFVATGWVFGLLDSVNPQDLWVFRTDSMGCLVPGCHLTDNITMHANEVAVSLYPNPVQNQLSVHIKAGDLPQGATIELYDMQGRQHLSTLLEPGARTYIIDMRHYASGVYLLHCKTPNELLWTGKILKN